MNRAILVSQVNEREDSIEEYVLQSINDIWPRLSQARKEYMKRENTSVVEKVQKDLEDNGFDFDDEDIDDAVYSILHEALSTINEDVKKGNKITAYDGKSGKYRDAIVINVTGSLVHYKWADTKGQHEKNYVGSDQIENIKTLNEGASGVRIKRGYTENHPEVKAGSRAPMREAILEFVSDKSGCTYEELSNFIKKTNENNIGGKNTSMKWVKNNKRYFNESTKNGVTSFKLSKIGKRVVEQLHPKPIAPLEEGSISELELLRKHSRNKEEFIKDGYGVVKTKGKWAGKKADRKDIEKYLEEYFDSMDEDMNADPGALVESNESDDLNEGKDFEATFSSKKAPGKRFGITIKGGSGNDAAEKLYYDIGELIIKSKLDVTDIVIKTK